MADEKRFPILLRGSLGGAYSELPHDVDWALVEGARKSIERNHGQTLERLAERGGLAPNELLAGLLGRPLFGQSPGGDVQRMLLELIVKHDGGSRPPDRPGDAHSYRIREVGAGLYAGAPTEDELELWARLHRVEVGPNPYTPRRMYEARWKTYGGSGRTRVQALHHLYYAIHYMEPVVLGWRWRCGSCGAQVLTDREPQPHGTACPCCSNPDGTEVPWEHVAWREI